ncbi:MAG TPA: Spy/CpxP family protein refolding chaperone [Bradyrhizobium sp.]|nr:Spy/CpxP family protein refolding chaperone [Bradyrhizobium sp.]
MRRFLGITLPLVLVCLIAGNDAMAQGRGGRGRGGFGGMFPLSHLQLLGLEQVQKELKLSEDQVAKVKELQEEWAKGFQPGGGGNFQNLTPDERRARFEEMQKKNEEFSQKASAVLTPDQSKNFLRVQIWANGVTSALTQNHEVAKQLQLTSEQKESLKTTAEESGKKMRELFPQFQGADEQKTSELRAEMDKIRKSTEEECLAYLTDDQKAQFDKLKGEKFDLDRTKLGPPGGGRRGRPGGNNN